MLVSFSVSNFRSISEKQTFSLQTAGKVRELPQNVIWAKDLGLLRSIIVYGRNASGKSNLLLAMDTLRRLTADSDVDLSSIYMPNKLCAKKQVDPIWFELIFFADDNIKYKYEVSFDSKAILQEKLYYYPEGKPSKLFSRESGKKISLGNTFKGNITDVEEKLYAHNTLLSRVAYHKIDSLVKPYTFFTRHFITHSFALQDRNLLEHFQVNVSKNSIPFHLENINKLLNVADTGIKSIEVKEFKEEEFNFPPDLDEKTRKRFIIKNRYRIYTYHNIYDEKGEILDTVRFNIDEESAGTIKLLSLGSVMLDCLNDGDVLFVDELDKSLHPILTKALIAIFNNPKTNPKNAQLIFASHDVSLLNSGLFRRDQIWFAEKDIKGSTEYYSLADFTGIRKDIPFGKHYLNGSFGGTPVINDYDFEFKYAEDEN